MATSIDLLIVYAAKRVDLKHGDKNVPHNEFYYDA